MSRCKDCRHYKASSIDGDCSSPKFKYGYGPTDLASDEVLIESDEGWCIIIGPDFGCIHFEEK